MGYLTGFWGSLISGSRHHI